MEKVLIVDDDRTLRGILGDIIEKEGMKTSQAESGAAAIKVFRTDRPDTVILDLNMTGMDGMETMSELRKIDPMVPVIILTAYGDIQTAVRAIQKGAYDFSVKPPEFERLLITLKRAIEKRMLSKEMEARGAALDQSLQYVLGKSDAMKKVIRQITQVAPTNLSVIIQGETGTGKSFIANQIRNISARADKPFICVDISLIPDPLIESELFGCKKGAFTGAERDRQGYFETAHEGTIFIDELQNMSPVIQSKLLSVIERKTIYPLGCSDPREVDVRVIAATNRDMNESMAQKTFRQDLFFRLSEFVINIPPLRARKDDIVFFADKFIFENSRDLNKQIRVVTDDAVSLLKAHSWPGNLRELKNVIRRAALIADTDTIDSGTISLVMQGFHNDLREKEAAGFMPLRMAFQVLEKRLIIEALEKTKGNKTRAAKLLEVSYTNLLEKIREYSIGLSGND